MLLLVSSLLELHINKNSKDYSQRVRDIFLEQETSKDLVAGKMEVT
jgi:hypothetical protein